jgi:hemerythrin-like domain-containing protein
MREHGVLKRILLIYREGIRRLHAGDQDPSHALNASAGIIRSFIEDYHEHLEEQYAFPKLEQAGRLTDITSVLRVQHQRGRVLTDRILSATAGAAARDQPAGGALVEDMSAFIRMYEPHEAREDTVVLPRWGMCCRLRSFVSLLNASKTRSTSGSVRPASKGWWKGSPILRRALASTT